MKKIKLLLCLFMLTTLCGCSNSNKNESSKTLNAAMFWISTSLDPTNNYPLLLLLLSGRSDQIRVFCRPSRSAALLFLLLAQNGQKYRMEYPDDIHMQPHGQKRGICLLQKNGNESLPVQDDRLCLQPGSLWFFFLH